MAKNTGQGRRIGAVRSRSEFKVGKTWYKPDATTGRILNGSPRQHKGVRKREVAPGSAAPSLPPSIAFPRKPRSRDG